MTDHLSIASFSCAFETFDASSTGGRGVEARAQFSAVPAQSNNAPVSTRPK